MRHELTQDLWLNLMDEIEAMTRRSYLEVGFNHSVENLRELKTRLIDIAQFTQHLKTQYSIKS